ncbi:hypothetical protein ACFYW6_38840 [Streptomyces sp. NPDC002659]|uniref:hypothetical protein n=1 Tax=Streptomyces sp. NPDC002659 TaxID=3364656 RepID=UPI0036B2711E
MVEEPAGGAMPSAASDEQRVAMLVDRARSEGLQLTGEGGLLQQLTKPVLEPPGLIDPPCATSAAPSNPAHNRAGMTGQPFKIALLSLRPYLG